MTRTHERNVLVWLVALMMGCCGCDFGGGPTAPADAFQISFESYAQAFADCLDLGEVRVRWDLDSKETPHCGAFPGGSLIVCKGPIPFQNPRGIAAHEVCHLSGLGGEWEAELCAHELLQTCP